MHFFCIPFLNEQEMPFWNSLTGYLLRDNRLYQLYWLHCLYRLVLIIFQVLNESLPDDERPLLKFDYLCKCDKLCEVQVYLVIRCVKF